MSTSDREPVAPSASGRARWELFLISVLLLFLELACIRWFPAHVLFLTFFTNMVLLACFLGMSLGCLAVHHRRDYLTWTPLLLGLGLVAGTGMEVLHKSLEKVIDVGHQTSPQMVYFGTEYHTSDLAKFAIPVEAITGFFFVLLTLAMVGPGQVLGRSLRAVPGRVQAYTINILGSIAGIVLFGLCSWYQMPPVAWFVPIAAGLAYFLLRDRLAGPQPRLAWSALAVACLLPVFVLLPAPLRARFGNICKETYWSPYYRITYSGAPQRTISVNLLGHQQMISRAEPHPAYALPHLLNRDAQGQPFKDILIIGAGSGNDVSRALEWGAPDVHIDAVEIDPVIHALGKRDHPDRPYQDPRVTVHLDDGRNFLRSTDKKYDLIMFALVDSLVLHSSFSNIRLESYLFTRQAFADVHKRLKPDGLFVMYNYFRQGWIVARLTQSVADVFGAQPLVMTLPTQEVIRPGEVSGGFTLCMAGPPAETIRQAFAQQGSYVLPANITPDARVPDGFAGARQAVGDDWLRFLPARVEQPEQPLAAATDNWPFLYLREPMVPKLSLRGMLLIGGISLGLLFCFAPRRQGQGSRWAFDGRMFFLGAGFMLIETKAVVHMALLFGSTWMVNSVVFFAVLLMILAANLWVLKCPTSRVGWAYGGLAATLLLNAVVPLDFFLGLPWAVQVTGSCLLVFAPILFAGVIFAVSFQQTREPDRAFGYNIGGAMLGGLAENLSMLLGFQYLVLVALGFYAVSSVFRAGSAQQAAPAEPVLSAPRAQAA